MIEKPKAEGDMRFGVNSDSVSEGVALVYVQIYLP